MFETILKFAPLGNLITACLASVGLLLAWRQVQINRQNEAKRQFVNFLDECMKKPALSMGDFENSLAGKAEYHWFISKLLMSSESILENFPKDPEWRSTIEGNLSRHIPHLNSADVDLKNYSNDLVELIAEIRKSGGRPILKGVI